MEVEFGTKKVTVKTSDEVDPEALVKAFEGTEFQASVAKN